MDLLVVLDSQSEQPLHKQLYDEIRKAILSGRLSRGQKVPSTRALAESLGISRATVTLAYDFLLSEGYLQSSSGSGTFVCRELPEALLRTDLKDGKKRARLDTAQLKKGAGRRLSKYGNYLRERPWFSYGEDEPEIQFAFGRPDKEQFPWRVWMQIVSQVIKRKEYDLLDCPSKSLGYYPLREVLASHLSKTRAANCSPDQIIIVNGSQQGIDLVTRILIDRGDLVGIEEPGYIGAKKAFEVAGAQLIALPVDKSGLVLDKLKDPSMSAMKLIYLTPSHQFPTGVVLSLPRRLELLNWAQRTGTYLIEDDYDSEYRYSGRPVPSLVGLDQTESVIYIGTFSKTLLPALRLGYIVVPPGLTSVFTRAKFLADRHTPLLYQETLAEFIKGGHLERHTRRMRTLYEHRRRVVIAALQLEFGSKVEILGENAGINLLIRIHMDMDDDEFLKNARKLGVGLVGTSHFYLSQAPAHEFLLNYAGLDDELLQEGIARIFRAAELSSKSPA